MNPNFNRALLESETPDAQTVDGTDQYQTEPRRADHQAETAAAAAAAGPAEAGLGGMAWGQPLPADGHYEPAPGWNVEYGGGSGGGGGWAGYSERGMYAAEENGGYHSLPRTRVGDRAVEVPPAPPPPPPPDPCESNTVL